MCQDELHRIYPPYFHSQFQFPGIFSYQYSGKLVHISDKQLRY